MMASHLLLDCSCRFSFLIFVLKTLYEKETGNEERYESSPVLPVISVVQDSSNSIFCDYDFF